MMRSWHTLQIFNIHWLCVYLHLTYLSVVVNAHKSFNSYAFHAFCFPFQLKWNEKKIFPIEIASPFSLLLLLLLHTVQCSMLTSATKHTNAWERYKCYPTATATATTKRNRKKTEKKKKTSAAQTKMDNITKLFLYRYTVVCRMVAFCIVCISLYSFRIQLNLSAKYVSDVSVCVCLCSGILPSDSMRRYATYMHLYNKHEHWTLNDTIHLMYSYQNAHNI